MSHAVGDCVNQFVANLNDPSGEGRGQLQMSCSDAVTEVVNYLIERGFAVTPGAIISGLQTVLQKIYSCPGMHNYQVGVTITQDQGHPLSNITTSVVEAGLASEGCTPLAAAPAPDTLLIVGVLAVFVGIAAVTAIYVGVRSRPKDDEAHTSLTAGAVAAGPSTRGRVFGSGASQHVFQPLVHTDDDLENPRKYPTLTG